MSDWVESKGKWEDPRPQGLKDYMTTLPLQDLLTQAPTRDSFVDVPIETGAVRYGPSEAKDELFVRGIMDTWWFMIFFDEEMIAKFERNYAENKVRWTFTDGRVHERSGKSTLYETQAEALAWVDENNLEPYVEGLEVVFVVHPDSPVPLWRVRQYLAKQEAANE